MKTKSLLLLSVLLCVVAMAIAQAPQAMNYQAVVRNAQGQLLQNTLVNFQFQVIDSVSHSVVYTETDTVTSNAFGLATIQIGHGAGFGGITWGTGNKYLRVGIDVSGGTNFVSMGTSQLVSVPYAMYTSRSGNGSWTLNGNSIYNSNAGNVGIGTSTPAASAVLEVKSTTGAVLLPRMTSAQRNSLSALLGMVIYNTDSGKFQGLSLSTVVDQSFTTYDNGGYNDMAQSFTAGITGNLTAISLLLTTTATIDSMTIAILAGDGPGGTVLSSQQFVVLNGNPIWYNFNISGVSVTAGSKYTIHVTNTTACTGVCDYWGYNTSGGYTGGTAYFQGAAKAWSYNFTTTVSSNVWTDLN